MEAIIAVVVALGISLGAFYIYQDYQRTRQSNNNSNSTSSSSSSNTRTGSNSSRNHIPAPKVVRPDVDSMSKAQLLDYARELNLKVNVRNRKVDILDKIKTHLNNE